jgi:hypothetical protein
LVGLHFFYVHTNTFLLAATPRFVLPFPVSFLLRFYLFMAITGLLPYMPALVLARSIYPRSNRRLVSVASYSSIAPNLPWNLLSNSRNCESK